MRPSIMTDCRSANRGSLHEETLRFGCRHIAPRSPMRSKQSTYRVSKLRACKISSGSPLGPNTKYVYMRPADVTEIWSIKNRDAVLRWRLDRVVNIKSQDGAESKTRIGSSRFPDTTFSSFSCSCRQAYLVSRLPLSFFLCELLISCSKYFSLTYKHIFCCRCLRFGFGPRGPPVRF